MNISNTMQEAINKQIVWELYSSMQYLDMAFWLQHHGWNGFAKWMYRHSDEEKSHAIAMANYVINRGGEVHIGAVNDASGQYSDPLNIFEQAMCHEMMITELIHSLADTADREHDRASANFISRFIDEQVEEESAVRDVLNLFRHRDGHTVATIDDIVGNSIST